MKRKTLVVDFLILFLLASVLIWPLYKLKYADNWASIESTFISDARFLKEHWPHPNWQPFWYNGTRTDFVYPPALRYGTAALAKYYPRMTEARAYHIYTAFFYCIGIAGVYLFVRVVGGHRGSAWLAAAAAALLSPSFLFLPEIRNDSLILTPQRLGVLVRYGEGPHMTAFALLPIALAASFRALEAWRPAALAAAGVLCALVVSNNFYGATALAIWFPIVAWSVWVTHMDKWIAARAAAIAALAYGLTACWLTPAFLITTLNNLRLVAEPGNAWSRWVMLFAVMGFILATDRFCRGRKDRCYPAVVWATCVVFTMTVLGYFFLGFRVIGEPGRLVPEFDLAFILLAAEILRRAWERPWVYSRALCAAVVVFSFLPAKRYVRRAYTPFVQYGNYKDRIEYRLTEWMAKNHPRARTMASGSVRFWYNAWFDLAQLGGGSEQGTINQHVNLAFVRIILEDNPDFVKQWLHAFGIDFIITHEPRSQEIYHDFVAPRKFAPYLPQIFDDGEGNLIYQVPRRWPSLARVVDRKEFSSIPVLGGLENQDIIAAYAKAVEHGPDAPATFDWEGTDAFRVRARISEGQSVALLITFDPAWHASSNGVSIPSARDSLGQLRLDPPPGDHDIRVVYQQPKQNIAGRGLTVLSLCAVAGLFVAGRRKRM